jgi:hypothetical protein
MLLKNARMWRMNIEEIVSQPAITVTPGSWPVPRDADMPKFDEPSEAWIADLVSRETTERIWPRVFPGL